MACKIRNKLQLNKTNKISVNNIKLIDRNDTKKKKKKT